MKIFLSILITLSLSAHTLSSTSIKDKIHLTSFIAPTLIHTTDNNFFGDTDDDIGTDYMEIGLIGKYDFTERFSFVAELLYKGVGASKNEPDIDFAFFDYNYFQNFNHNLGIRLGKIKIPYGLYNSTRDAPFTRKMIFLPQAIYFENYRDPAFSQRGVDFNGQHTFDYENINWNFGITVSSDGDREINNIYENAHLMANFEGDNSGFARLAYISPSNDFTAAVSHTLLTYYVDTKIPFLIKSGKLPARKTLLSFEYFPTEKNIISDGN